VAKTKTNTAESATIQVDADTLSRLLAVSQLFDIGSIERTLAAIVERFHAAHLQPEGRLPAGWQLRDDLTLIDLEAYYASFEAEEKSRSQWRERGRTIRAAVAGGWFAAPDGLTKDDVAKMKPSQAPAIAAAVNELYLRVATADPNW
jgi:hypothetical protein